MLDPDSVEAAAGVVATTRVAVPGGDTRTTVAVPSGDACTTVAVPGGDACTTVAIGVGCTVFVAGGVVVSDPVKARGPVSIQ